jgi:hypothetical protein
MFNDKEKLQSVLQGLADMQQRLLMQRQFEMYPNSTILSPQEVIAWALEDVRSGPLALVDPVHVQNRRLRAIAMALQYPALVWYKLPNLGKVSGCRIGMGESDYLSNFSDL